MNVDTKLRQAGKGVRNARRGEFTVRSPSTRSGRLNGPALAAATAMLVVAAIGVPAFLTSGPSSEPADPAANAAAPPASQPNNGAPAIEPDSFPYLGLELADSVVYDAYDVTDDVTGEVVGTHIEYLQTWTHESGEDVGRVIELRVQRTSHEYARFDELVAASTSSSIVQVGDREVTLYTIPDDATDECCYDLGVLRWTETPGIEAIVIPWGLNTDEAIQLLDKVEPLNENRWHDILESVVPTATTVVIHPDDMTATTPADDS